MKKKIIIIGSIVLLLVLGLFIYCNLSKKVELKETKMNVVLSLEDIITDDSIWCGTFNLIWNDLKNDLAKQDIVFDPQLDIVENLNKGTFTTKDLNDDSYYKIYGNPTPELKKTIEKAIKDKFNETSDILDDFDFVDRNPKDHFLYAMLKKEFKFNKAFTEINTIKYKNQANVTFFGINSTTNEEVLNQVEVLYYEDQNNFAIKLITTSNDEVILIKGNNDSSFKDVYETLNENSKKYTGNKSINSEETVAVPNIEFKIKKEFTELENKEFSYSNDDIYVIDKAMQTIEFELDKEGGRIKSEAGMSNKYTSAISGEEYRSFILDDTFIVMLKEKDKNLPYFAAKISNINYVQDLTK